MAKGKSEESLKIIKKIIALLAILALATTMFLSFFAVPQSKALEVNLDTGLEESLCDGLEGTDLLECESEGTTSFTDFQGEFAPPEEEGYASGITKVTSAREYIVNVTNFVLSFLGLAGVVVIIYGGFLYVTAGGEEEQANKGKKSVTYAVIGIIIVLGSYAIVNTLVGAAGDGGDPSSGLYTKNGVSSESLNEFQSQEIAQNIQKLTEAFVTEYTNYINVASILEAMAAVDSFDEEGLKEMQEGFELILQQVDSLSNTADTANKAIQSIKGYLSYQMNQKAAQLAEVDEWGQANVLLAETSTESVADSDPYDSGSELIGYMSDISDQSLEEYQQAVKDIQTEMEQLQGSFESLTTINGLFTQIINYLSEYETTSNYGSQNYTFESASGTLKVYDTPPGGSQRVGEIVDLFNRLYNVVKELEFTTAILTANTNQGNAPVTITFNGLDSYDPTNQTIPAANYQWDLLGDGFNDAPDDKEGPNVSYTYESPGTYRVALRVTSSDPENIASGISYLSIKVNPASSIISLTGDPGSDGADVTDLSALTGWTVTGEQAKSGITFDAGGTVDGDGNSDTIVSFSYDFGDGETQTGESPTSIHYYSKEGTYSFNLEVTDQNGIKDRKNVTIEVASPAAYLEASKTTAEIDEKIAFDASGSLTDNGNITNYKWSITKDSKIVYTQEGNDVDLIEYQMKEPGEYLVQIEVTDSAEKTDDESLTVTINSSAPVPTFTYSIPDSSEPNRVYFDASESYDPDEKDVLSYKWEIEGETGTDYDFVESTTIESQQPIVDFYSVGEHKVILTVSDQYEPPIQQSASVEQKVTVESILGIKVETVGDSVSFLEESGLAGVTLEVTSGNSEAYEIDWKDDSDVETLNGGAQTIKHQYEEAGTYLVEVTAFGEGNESNEVIHNVYVGNGTEPIAIIHVTIDGTSEAYDGAEIEGNRETSFKFDASESIDLNGKSLPSENITWNTGDGTIKSGKTLTHVYDEMGTFEVTLTVKSAEDPTVSSTAAVTVTIEGLSPEIYGLTATPESDELVTPLNVKIEVNAQDRDGEISSYKFWYYDVNNSGEKLDTQISPSASAYMTINTNGTTGEVNTYGFGVEVIDDENNGTSSEIEFSEAQIPTLEVENGPNKSPKADFNVDRTNVLVGEEVNFSSTSSDEDGEIKEYIWDFEGDGFYNNQSVTQSSTTHVFEKSSEEGIEVRLKVVDEGGASDVSDPVRIYVDSLTKDPEAAFNTTVSNLDVTFTNNSKADSANGASLISYEWDFDEKEDTDGNGNFNDDTDSIEESPKHTYKTFDTYRVTLIVTDNEGNTDEVTRSVVIDESSPPEAAFTTTIDDKIATFKNSSTVDAGTSVKIEGYQWDFDTLKDDSNGNGDFADDVDSADKDPKKTYEAYGKYKVKLTVTDSLGRKDEIVKEINVEEPKAEELTAFLNSTPAPQPSDNKIHLQGTSGNITFNFSSSGGIGEVKYVIDKNVYFDSDGSGKTTDDANHSATAAGSYTTDFYKEWGLIVVQLIVTDSEGRTAKVTKEVVFDASSAATSILPVTTGEALTILAMALGFTFLGAQFYTRKEKSPLDSSEL
ncbi:MAG: hypothetical protein ACD_28C00071G0004 [uncultured bacterium]|nr:MAG: hypothetical protein ACD_28C00071G0004 [uncultured bacterium]